MNINIKKDNRLCKLLFAFLTIAFFFSGCLKIVPVTGVKIDGGDKYLKIGETLQLSATIEPSDATNKAIIWESSDNSKVTVDEKGLVTAIAKTGAEITVITKDGKYEDTIAVFVGIANPNNSTISPGATCDSCNPCNSCNTCDTCNTCDPCNTCNTCNPCNTCDPCGSCEPNPCNSCNLCEPCNTCEPCSTCDPCNSDPCNPCSQ